MSEWRAVAGFPKYLVSDDGVIEGPGLGGKRKVLTPKIRPRGGYHVVHLRDGAGRAKTRFVHRLVLETFVGPCPQGMQAAHIDGDPSNNRLNNLKWVTAKENGEHRRAHGTNRRGELSHLARLRRQDVEYIRRHYAGNGRASNSRELAEKFGITMGYVCDIVRGKTWSHIRDEN